jgi:VWFA-related protein
MEDPVEAYLMLARCSVTLILAISGFVSAPLWAQTSQADAQEPPVPTIRVSTHLVLIDVVVTDKYGQPMLGLRAQDFTLEEKGKNQKISFFTPPASSGSQPAAPPLPPGTYSNRPEYRAPRGPTTVLLLDAANTPFQDQSYGRIQMLEFVRDQAQAGQPMAIFALTSELVLLQDFTSDPQILLNALLQYQPHESIGAGTLQHPPDLANSFRLNPALAEANAEIQHFQAVEVAYVMDRRVETTLSALRSLARILGGIPGRKNVVWLTAAFPFSLFPNDLTFTGLSQSEPTPCSIRGCVTMPTNQSRKQPDFENNRYAERVRDVAAQLASSQVAIYPVDVRGLATNSKVTGIPSQMTMQEMAWETGGRAFVNRNDIHNGIALALRDNSASYTIGYYPEDKHWDRKYRTINVKVNRGGVDVRHRRGYFAIDPSQGKDRKPDQELAEALQDKAPDTQVVFDATVRPVDKTEMSVEFLIDVSSISAEDAPGGKKVDVGFYAAIFSPAGKVLASQSARLDHTFPLETYRQILQQGMKVHVDLDSPPGKNELRMAVRDNHTGYLGTINAALVQ